MVSYSAPTLERLGTVAGLTASDIKCTPGTDSGYTLHDDVGGEYNPPLPSDFSARLAVGNCVTHTDPQFPN